MLYFKIHNGEKDWVIVEGETIEDVIKQAGIETKRRNWDEKYLWSEEIV